MVSPESILRTQLENASTFSELSSIVSVIASSRRDPAIMEGRSFTLTEPELGLLKTKIRELYHEKTRQNIPLTTNDYLELSALIYDIKALSETNRKTQGKFRSLFSEDKNPLNKSKFIKVLERVCLERIQSSNEHMNRIISEYDALAGLHNERIEIQGGIIPEDTQLFNELTKLKFYNKFIGLKWDDEQLSGKSRIPLSSDYENVASPIKSLQDCKTIALILTLINSLKNNPEITVHKNKIVLSGGKEIRFDKLNRLIVTLAKKELSQFPSRKAETAFKIAVLIHKLGELDPKFRKKQAKLMNKCVTIVKSNPVKFAEVAKRYQELSSEINAHVTNKYANNRSGDPWIANSVTELDFFSNFMNIQLNVNQLNLIELVPEVIDPEDRFNNLIKFNQAVSIINFEIEVREKVKEYKNLKFLTDPQNLMANIRTAEENTNLHERLEAVEKWLCLNCQKNKFGKFLNYLDQNPDDFLMPEPFFQSLLKNNRQLAESFNIQLTQAQASARDPWPTKEFNQEGCFYQPEIVSLTPMQTGFLNQQIQYFNHWNNYKRLCEQSYELAHQIRTTDVRSPQIPSILRALSSINKKIEKFPKKEASLFHFENDREKRFWMDAKLVPYYESFSDIPLTKAQREGKEDFPLLDISKLPVPPHEVLKNELENNYPPETIDRILETYPKEWLDSYRGLTELESEASSEEDIKAASISKTISFSEKIMDDEELDEAMNILGEWIPPHLQMQEKPLEYPGLLSDEALHDLMEQSLTPESLYTNFDLSDLEARFEKLQEPFAKEPPMTETSTPLL